MLQFEDHGLSHGIWRGLLRGDAAPARVVLTYLGQTFALATLSPDAPGVWRVEVTIPSDALSQGAQTLLLLADDGADLQPPQPGAQSLAHLHMLFGAPLDQEIAAELELLRAEVDLMKRQMRRLAMGE